MSNEDSVRAAIDATVERYGKLTTLVNNAAATDLVNVGMKPLTEHSTEEWDAIIRTTLTGNVFWACKYGIPHLIAAGGGSIINVSSGGAMFGSPGISAYSAAKGGMNAVTRTIVVEYAPDNIRCNVIVVGRVVSHPKDRGPNVPGALTRSDSRATSRTPRCGSRPTSRNSSPAPPSPPTAACRSILGTTDPDGSRSPFGSRQLVSGASPFEISTTPNTRNRTAITALL